MRNDVPSMDTRERFPEGNNELVSKGPCPECPSSDGFATYADGHAHCYVCGHWQKPPRGGEGAAGAGEGGSARAGHDGKQQGQASHRDDRGSDLLRPSGTGDPYSALGKRALLPTTLKRFGYFQHPFKGQVVHVAPYYDQAGELACQKLRFPNKEFVVLKASSSTLTDCQLFGQKVYGEQFNKRVVVTEGELDAISVAQAMDFGLAAVSVAGGAKGAAKSVKANWRWLDGFTEIIFWFDDDEPGREAMEECAKLFAVGKVKLARVAGRKDASDCLQANQPGEIRAAIFAATTWRPAGIVNAADNSDDVCVPKADGTSGWSYKWPWASLNETLGPILPGQVTYHVAGTGIGKTTAIAEIEYDLVQQGAKVFHMGFEDTRRDVKLRLMSIKANQKLDATPLDDDAMRALHAEVFGSRLIEMFDPETAEWSVPAILGYVRYCVKALGCRVGFIDPLSFIAAGLSLGDDERRTLDKASRDLAAGAKELGVHLQIAHHLTDPRDGKGHTEGAASHLNQVRGSGGIANFATFVIGHERNQQAEGDQFLLTQLRALKNRPRSITGPMQVLKYDMVTGRLKPTKEPFPASGEGRAQRQGQRTMPPASDDY